MVSSALKFAHYHVEKELIFMGNSLFFVFAQAFSIIVAPCVIIFVILIYELKIYKLVSCFLNQFNRVKSIFKYFNKIYLKVFFSK